MQEGRSLTTRDIRILGFLKEQGIATATQLEQLFFGSSDSFRVRIAKLKRAGLIETVSLSHGVDSVPSRMIELRHQFLSQGKNWHQARLYKLSKEVSSEVAACGSGLYEPIFWQHQIGLSEIRRFLGEFLKGGTFISDPESKREWSRFQIGLNVPIPDLVWRKSSTEFAFEFERTNKGEARYFERMARYQKSAYKKVLFFANNDSIANTLINCSRRFPQIGISSKSNLEKLYTGMRGYMTVRSFLEL